MSKDSDRNDGGREQREDKFKDITWVSLKIPFEPRNEGGH